MRNERDDCYRLGFCLFAFILLLSVGNIYFLLSALTLELILLLRWEQIQTNAKRYAILLFFVFLGALPLAFERIGEEAFFQFLGWGITQEGIRLASLVMLRSLTSCLLISIMLYLIPIYRLCQILRLWRVPGLFVDLMELSYRYIHLLLERGEYIKDAQLLRLGYRTWRERYRHGGMLLSRSFILAHSEAEDMYEGLLTRHFEESNNSTTNTDVRTTETEGDTLLSLDKIVFAYNKTQIALNEVSLDIKRGERIVLLGANGSGKSTLMKLLAGLHREQSGLFILEGQELNRTPKDLRRQRERIALIMQNANHQLFCPSVEDEIAFGLRNSGYSEEEVSLRVEEIIVEYHLESLRSKPPHLLSEGQKKWVSIAAIMALRPDVILMDEPTACLDCYYTEQVMRLASSYCDAGCTVILSTHDMNLAYDWADRAIVMNAGSKIFDGLLDDLYSDQELLKQAKLRQPYGFEKSVTTNSKSAFESEEENQSIALNPTYRLGLFLDSSSLKALIVGGGKGAVRKALTLLKAGVQCTVIAPNVSSELSEYEQSGHLNWICREVEESDLDGYDLIVAATNDAELNHQICSCAKRLGKLASNLSNPKDGNIQFAALLDDKGIQIAVHTRYSIPEVAQSIREKIARSLVSIDESDLINLSELRKEGQLEEYRVARERFVEKLSL